MIKRERMPTKVDAVPRIRSRAGAACASLAASFAAGVAE